MGKNDAEHERKTAAKEVEVDTREIQGNILAGFKKDYQTLLFLQIVDVDRAKRWLSKIEPMIATHFEVQLFNKVFKEIRSRRGDDYGTVKATWVNIAFSFEGLRKLRKDAGKFKDKAFKQGMPKRATKFLGDPAEPKSEGNPKNWVVGCEENKPDVVLIVASDDRYDLLDEMARLETMLSMEGGLVAVFKQQGGVLPPPQTGHEHFGFKDGISHPGVRGVIKEEPHVYLTQRRNPNDPNQGDPGQELIWPGEFVFGYPKQDPKNLHEPGSIAHGGPEWAKNGSFLVFRRLRQDVSAFRRFVQETAKELAKKHPSFAGTTPELVGAKLVGRWASGAPLMRAPQADDPGIAESGCTDNHFDFIKASKPIKGGAQGECTDNIFPQSPGDDPGLLCPHAAHIRKSYSRDDPTEGGGKTDTETRRLMRRGIPYGDPFRGMAQAHPEGKSGKLLDAKDERGLLFLAYQTSIEEQFEFITQFWINNPDFRDKGDGFDPLLAQNGGKPNGTRFFTFPVKEKDGTITTVRVELPGDLVVPTGGGYFFAPSIRALKLLAK